MDAPNLTFGLAFLAGLASFFSPCVFSLVPAYIGYLGGRTMASNRRGRAEQWTSFSHGLAFVAGFSLIFISLGLGASALGAMLYDAKIWLARIGGIAVIIFGLHMTGLFRIKFLEYDLRAQTVPDRRRGYLASFLMGVFFSAGWAPCVGPILGSILTLSAYSGDTTQGLLLLTFYSLGLAIPFLIASLEIGLVTNVLRRYGKVMHYVEVSMGVVLIIVGVLLLTGEYAKLASASASLFSVYNEEALGRALIVAIITLAFLGLMPAAIAWRKGRSFGTWWLFGATLFPIALPASLLIKPVNSEPEPPAAPQEAPSQSTD
jgi:cytochrome c-type biogenesis protein